MARAPSFVVGRFAVFDEIAAGGMARVHLGRLIGGEGFSRTVAIKRIHPELAADPEFVAMFLDEARLMGRIRHANVVQVIDVVASDGALIVAMEYVHGAALSRLQRGARERGERLAFGVAARIAVDVLRGLHEAHEARSELGAPLEVVHRDVTPQNILVGVDGSSRVADFGVAKASQRAQATTREGQLKGKLGYMAPEQLRHEHFDRRTDIYATSVVLWEALTGVRLFEPGNEGRQLTKILFEPLPRPSTSRPDVRPTLEAVVMRGLDRDPARRFSTAREMAEALEGAVTLATSGEVGDTVSRLAAEELASRAARIAEIEKETTAPSLPSLVGPPGGVPASPVTVDVPPGDATPAPFPARPRSSALAVPLALVACGALVAVAVVWSRSGRPASVAPTPPLAPTAIATLAATPPVSNPAPATSASSGAPEISPSARPTPSTRRPARATRPASGGDCDPPFRVDSSGIRHLKPECM